MFLIETLELSNLMFRKTSLLQLSKTFALAISVSSVTFAPWLIFG